MARYGESDRLLRSSAWSNGLVLYLNTEGPGRTRTEVLKIFELCRRLDELRRADDSDDERTGLAERFNKRAAEVGSIQRTLNTSLTAFVFAPSLVVTTTAIDILWRPRRGNLESIAESGEPHIPTASIVQTILEMTADCTLSRIRQCFCGKWFFAQTNKKVACSDACRFRKFRENDPEGYNEQRAEYMREYRANPKVKAKSKKRNRS